VPDTGFLLDHLKNRGHNCMTQSGLRKSNVTALSCRSLFGVFVIAIAILFLSACSQSNSGSGNTSSAAASSAPVLGGLPDPCSLVTQAEVESALGKGATMNSFNNQRIGMQECRLKPASPGVIEEVLIIVHKADMWDGIKKAMLPPSSDAKVVPGLGDDAFVGRAVGYNVRKGDKYVQVFGAVTNNDAANEKATRYLVERALSRL
jgi:hypothetical protein